LIFDTLNPVNVTSSDYKFIHHSCKMKPLYLVQENQHCACGIKNGAIPLHRIQLEISMTELSESIADIFLLTYSLSSALMTSQRRSF